MGGFFCFDLLPLATPALPTRRVNYSGRPAKPLEPCSQGEPQPWITSIISTDLQRLVHSAVVYAFIYGDDFGMTYRYQTQRLRGGRVSITGRVYLVTCTTRHRYPHFANHLPAREACRTIQSLDRMGASHTWCFVVMPDHCHWLFCLNGKYSLEQTVRMFKGKCSRLVEVNLWQKGFHDRALRSDEDLLPIARYVIANPLRAGLVERVGEYPYWDAAWL